jgi:hypothetical protein
MHADSAVKAEGDIAALPEMKANYEKLQAQMDGPMRMDADWTPARWPLAH